MNVVLDHKITEKTREIRELVSTLDKKVSVPLLVVLKNCSQLSGDYQFDTLTSRTRQYAYLIMLCLESEGCSDFTTNDFFEICGVLNNIEQLYRQIHDDNDELIPNHLSDNQKKSMLAQSCYASKHFNTTLLYKEQEIDRIERVFCPFNRLIISNEGFSVDQMLSFFIETEQIIDKKNHSAIDYIFSNTVKGDNCLNFYSEDGQCISIPKDSYRYFSLKISDYTSTDPDVVGKMLNLFSISLLEKRENEQLRYYCQASDNVIEDCPIIKLEDGQYLIFDSNMLIVSIYNYLCKREYLNKNSLAKSKARAIESKVKEVFEYTFGDAKSFSNYCITPKGSEKDYLSIKGNKAFIVECKSDIQRIYSRDTIRTWNAVSRDFKTSIQKGYQQACEVAKEIQKTTTIRLYKKDSDVILDEIDCSTIKEIHILIVTQERYAIAQNDLELLLQKDFGRTYPTSICIDDLETELLTFKRLENPLLSFCEYLGVKEKMTSRILNDDELDLASYYLQARDELCKLIDNNNLYRIDTDYSNLFDALYNNGGIGFKHELYYPSKVQIGRDGIELYEVCKRIGLKLSESYDTAYNQYLSQQGNYTVEEVKNIKSSNVL